MIALTVLLPLQSMTLKYPAWLLLLLVVPLFAFWYYRKQSRRYPRWLVSDVSGLSGEGAMRGQLRILLPALRGVAWVLLVIALARPQSVLKKEIVNAEGIDIVLAMDLSSSMFKKDIEPSRRKVADELTAAFIDSRQYDRIGLVGFAGAAFTFCPLTTDYAILKSLIERFGKEKDIITDGTEIGLGLLTGVLRLKDSKSESKVLVIVTDGEDMGDEVPIDVAIATAKKYDIMIYAIGILSQSSKKKKKIAPERLLTHVVQSTGGVYYSARTRADIEERFAEINSLEKNKVEIRTVKRHREEAYRFIAVALLCLLLAFGLEHTLLRSLP